MTTIIYGAGASRGFFTQDLSTQFLTSLVKDIHVWQNALNNYYKKDLPSAQDIVGLINLICQANPDYHFEQICEVLDKYCSYQFDSFPGNTYLGNLLNVIKNQYCRCYWPINHQWGDVPFVYRQIIADAIVRLHNGFQNANYNQLLAQQTDFIDYVCRKFEEQVSVVSFNYDDLVYTSANALGFQTGFAPSVDPRAKGQKTIDVPRFFDAKKVVYFPHGHIRYRFVDSNQVLFYDDYKKANTARWQASDTFTTAITLTGQYTKFASNYNTFLTTGQTKDNSFNTAPYSYYYQRLAADILNSQRIILIGYSFGDEHVNRLLQSFVNRNPNNEVYIVDYYDVANHPITLVDELRDQRNIFMKISEVFKTPWMVTRNLYTQTTNPYNPQAVVDLNDNNIGYAIILPNITYYRKGYLNFLVDYQKFI